MDYREVEREEEARERARLRVRRWQEIYLGLAVLACLLVIGAVLLIMKMIPTPTGAR